MKTKILVTGATGQLGSELKDLWKDENQAEVIFLDRKLLSLDEPENIPVILTRYRPDIVVHAGAYTAVDQAESDAEMADKVNHLATEAIAKYCGAHHVKLIAISTDYVFDGNSDTALTEEAPTNPINSYGLTKWKGEQSIEKWCPEGIIIRTSWVYSIYGKNFVKTMIRLMSERDELSVINDQIGSPTNAKDLAVAISTIVHSNKWEGGIYNFSNEGEISWYDFAEAIKELKGFHTKINPIPTTAYPTPAKRPHYSLLDKSKIKAVYQVNVPEWKSSLAKTLEAL